MDWKPAIEHENLATKGRALFREGAKQIALFVVGEDVHAVDNRCPHQGFPLLKGTIDGEARLTCNWHNWKFDLGSGACVLGADNVRAYPTRVVDGMVEVDVADPSPEEVEEKLLADLEVGFRKRQYGRMARELTRLVFHGRDPRVAVRRALGWVHDRLEFGTTHAHAVAADWLTLAEEAADLEERVAFLTEALDHLAFDSLRHDRYPYPAEVGTWDRDAFLAAIEDEDEGRAIASIRGALAAGLGWAELEEPLAAAALAHYNDFGHALIYVQKSGELVRHLGEEVLEVLLLPLVRGLCYSTREDLIPEFQHYAPNRAAFPGEFGTGAANGGLDVVRRRGVKACLEAVVGAAAASTPAALLDELVRLNAWNMLRFDTSYQFAYDRPTPEHVGWLDYTHALTFAAAVAELCGRHPHLWADGLLQLACFAGRNHGFLLEDGAAEEEARRWVVADPEALDREAHALATDHGQGLPILAAHLVKTWLAVRQLAPDLGPGTRVEARSALNRFLHAPLKEKHVRRTIREALWLVGKDFPDGPAAPMPV